MSTLSYLRVQLVQAERRLAKYQRRIDEARDRALAHPERLTARAMLELLDDPRYRGAQLAVQNLTAALNREEKRLAAPAEALL